jgi:nicotinamide mononucleotide (NMN) deamidase PncC
VGLTYVAVDSDAHSAVKKHVWPYDREGNRLASVGAALDLLERAIA